jgi:hypothetical protein
MLAGPSSQPGGPAFAVIVLATSTVLLAGRRGYRGSAALRSAIMRAWH